MSWGLVGDGSDTMMPSPWAFVEISIANMKKQNSLSRYYELCGDEWKRVPGILRTVGEVLGCH